MRLGDSERRTQLVLALEALDEAASELEELVGMKARDELVEKIEKMQRRDLQGILIAAVLTEQQRRRSG